MLILPCWSQKNCFCPYSCFNPPVAPQTQNLLPISFVSVHRSSPPVPTHKSLIRLSSLCVQQLLVAVVQLRHKSTAHTQAERTCTDFAPWTSVAVRLSGPPTCGLMILAQKVRPEREERGQRNAGTPFNSTDRIKERLAAETRDN